MKFQTTVEIYCAVKFKGESSLCTCPASISLVTSHKMSGAIGSIGLIAWFQISAAMWMRSSPFWDIMQHGLVVSYWHFGTTYKLIFKGQAVCLTLEDGPLGCSKTLVTNYQSILHNIQEKWRASVRFFTLVAHVTGVYSQPELGPEVKMAKDFNHFFQSTKPENAHLQIHTQSLDMF